jgi:hypothetical protein
MHLIDLSEIGNSLTPGHLLQLFGVSGPLHRDLCGGLINVAEIVRREFDRGGPDVLVQTMSLGGAWVARG